MQRNLLMRFLWVAVDLNAKVKEIYNGDNFTMRSLT
jgi:hypothetical protein